MGDQPEALRLADALAAWEWSSDGRCGKAAAELRRLVAENERLHQINQSHEMKLSVRGYEIQIADLKAVNQELLEALKDALFHVANQGDVGVDQWLVCERNVRAAIAKAKEQK
jgi:hypothetical protein